MFIFNTVLKIEKIIIIYLNAIEPVRGAYICENISFFNEMSMFTFNNAPKRN